MKPLSSFVEFRTKMADRTTRSSLFAGLTKKRTVAVPPASRLDLSQIVVRPFDDQTVTNRFSCGKRGIDAFLKNKAKKSTRRMEHRVFCAHIGDSKIAIGFYALQVGTDSVAILPGSEKLYLKSYTAFPAVHLSFLGVQEDYRRQGLGSYLLMDAFNKVRAISEMVGFYALTLQSLDADSTAFYLSIGFAAYTDDPVTPKMLYPIEDILTLLDKPL